MNSFVHTAGWWWPVYPGRPRYFYSTRPPRSTGRPLPFLVKAPQVPPRRRSERGIPMQGTSYTTRGGIRIQRETWIGPYEREHDTLAHTLDDRRGVLLSSSFEFPGRYTRLDMGFVDPPLVLTARGRDFAVEALNERGRVLIPAIAGALAQLSATEIRRAGTDRIEGTVRDSDTRFPEEERSRQPSLFSVLRGFNELFGSEEDEHLGL